MYKVVDNLNFCGEVILRIVLVCFLYLIFLDDCFHIIAKTILLCKPVYRNYDIQFEMSANQGRQSRGGWGGRNPPLNFGRGG